MVPNLHKSCILCGATKDLNTAMGVTLEDDSKTKVQVHLCDSCAEDCTPKIARAAYVKKQAQIDEVIARAKELGMDLTQTGSHGLVAVTQPIQEQVRIIEQPARSALAGVVPVLEGDDVVPTSMIDRGNMVSVGGNAVMGNTQVAVGSHASHDVNTLKNKLPDDMRVGQAKMQIVEGRGGQPLVIPAMRSDKTGITRIRVVKSNDAQLQQRAKRLVAQSSPQEAWKRPSFKDGYMMENTDRSCPMCNGVGKVRNRGQEELCQRCQGTGVIVI